MRDLAEKFFLAFIPIFVAIDPIGLVALFIGLGTSASPENRKQQAFLGILTSLCVSIGFIFLGKIIFAALGITVADFQIAGGLILLVLDPLARPKPSHGKSTSEPPGIARRERLGRWLRRANDSGRSRSPNHHSQLILDVSTFFRPGGLQFRCFISSLITARQFSLD